MNYQSEQIDQVLAALSNAQGMYNDLIPSQDGPGGKYANLADIIKATKKALHQNKLCLFFQEHLLNEGSGAALLWTRLGHQSGQYIATCDRIFKNGTLISIGRRIEVQKRNAAMDILGISPSQHDPFFHDDNGKNDAEEAMIASIKNPTPKEEKSNHVYETISKTDYDNLMIELDNYPHLVKQIQDLHGLTTLADLRKEDYWPAVNQIRKIKKTEEDYIKNKRQ